MWTSFLLSYLDPTAVDHLRTLGFDLGKISGAGKQLNHELEFNEELHTRIKHCALAERHIGEHVMSAYRVTYFKAEVIL